MSIARRIMLLILVPAFALLGLAGWIVSDRWETAARMQRLLVGGRVIESLTGLVGSLQVERGRSAQYLGSKGAQFGQELESQRQVSDTKRALFSTTSEARLLAQLGDELTKTIDKATDALSALRDLRSSVTGQAIAASDSTKRYSAIVEQLLEVSFVIIRDADRSDIKNHSLALSFLQSAGEKAGVGRATGAAGLGAGALSAEQLNRLAGLAEEEREFVKLFEIYAPIDIGSAFANAMKAPGASEVDRLRDIILAAPPGEKLAGLDSGTWFKAATARVDLIRGVQDQLLIEIGKETEAALGSASNQLLAATAATVLLIALLVALGVMTVRSITRPLSAMVATMTRLAAGDSDVEIPAVGRKDEIGLMADTVVTFKQAAIEKQRLEAAAVEQRRLVEEERAEREAEKVEEMRQDRMAIDALGDGLGRLAAGDLAHCIDTPFAQKTEKLRQDFNMSIQKLRSTIVTIASNGHAVDSGTSEIKLAAEDLSRRTESQAASLEETAASLDEITATVSETAKSAHHASAVVSSAKQDAEKTREVVCKAVEAMRSIEGSSKEIGQIIVVIDEIAFQTNLLALNAGVEAARAGEAGRGFAVVATEVRALAQRSADAAKDIKRLISTAATQVDEGVELVGETGKALERILDQIADISGVVNTIASGAHEQSTGLQQVNVAVNQMDQVTQQNAAMVEQSTAAAHALADHAQELSRLISGFRIGVPAEQARMPRAKSPTIPSVAAPRAERYA
jgi:methyl-accepting chemotaxis protein